MTTTARETTAVGHQGALSAALVGAWTVAGLLAIGIAINVMVIAAGTTANTVVQAPVQMVAGAVGLEDTQLPPDVVVQRPADAGMNLSSNALNVIDADSTSAVLARADVWGLLLIGGAIMLLLVPVLRSATRGRPFAPGNARRLAIASVAAALGWVIAATLPMVATQRLLDHGAVGDRSGSFAPAFLPNYWLLAVVALLLVITFAFRHGERVTTDAEGLV